MIDIIRKYEPWIDYWVSEKDKGQADAINKGLTRATGEIFQFINSDDLLTDGAMQSVARSMTAHAVADVVIDFAADGTRTRRARRDFTGQFRHPTGRLSGPPTWRLAAHGAGSRAWRFQCDVPLQVRLGIAVRYAERWPRVAYIDDVLALFRIHDTSKTMSEGLAFWEEELIARELLSQRLVDPTTRAVLNRFVRRRNWRLRVDELCNGIGLTSGQAAANLAREAVRDPFRRIDRYSLGALRRIIHRSRVPMIRVGTVDIRYRPGV